MSNSEEMRRKLESMEADLAQTSVQPQASTTTPNTAYNDASAKNVLKPLAESFNRLNTVAKVAAIAVSLVVGLAILSAVLKIVTSVIVVAVLLFGCYLGYKFLLAEDSSRKGK